MDIRHAGIRKIAEASDLGTVTNGQILQYNSTTKKFDGVTLSLSDSTISGTLPITKGGTGATSASAARTGLGLVIGTNVQAYNADLLAIAALSHSDGNFIVSNGSAWVAESGATAIASLGLSGTVITTDNLSDITSIGTLSAAAITQTGTSGNGLYVLRDLASGSTDSPLVRVNNTNTSDDQTAVEIAQDGSGAVLDLKSDGVTVLKIPAGMGNGADGQVLTTDGDGVAAWEDTASTTSIAADNITAGDAAVTISTTVGAVNITPASGSAIVLDSTINIDAGVVTGVTSIAASSIVTSGDITIGDDLILDSDSAAIQFGDSQDVALTHVAGSGLTLKHITPTDNKPLLFTLATGETTLVADEPLAKIAFQAPDEASGGDSRLVAAAIQAVVDGGPFSTTSNATRLEFMTGSSEDATAKVTITSAGHIVPSTDNTIDLGTSSVEFRNAYFDGTLEADAITVDGVVLATYIRDTVGANMLSSNTESGITVTYDTSNDNIDFAIDAAQTGITSLLATDIKIGEDDQTKIDFETADEIHFYAANVEQVYLADNIFGPQTDSDVDLGATGVRWKDAYVDSITVTGEIDGASLDISGNADIDGTLEADAITVGGTALASVIAGTTVILAATAATVAVSDNESTDENDYIPFVTGGPSASGNVALNSDGDLHYNPSTGTVTATIFKGNIDAVDGDFDGTLEADAITIGGTNVVTGSLITTLGTISAGTWQGTAIASAYIADNAITGAKIALGSDAAGDIMYNNGTDYARLAKGSDGEVLKLASGVPSWGAASGGGSMSSFVISDGSSTQTIADSNTITFAATSNEITVAVSATDTVTIGLPDNVTIGGNLTVTTAILPDASGGADIGSTSAEWGDVYIGDSKTIKLGADQDWLLAHDGSTGAKITGTTVHEGNLTIQGASGNSGVLYLSADAGEDNSDLWRMLVADGGNLAISSKSSGSWVNKLALTSAGAVTFGGDLTISGDDLFMATNTSGYMLVADGTNFNPVAISGDATLASNGAVTIANNAVSLAKMASITRGSIIIGDASGDPAALVLGNDTYVLTSDGSDIAWAAAAGGTATAVTVADESSDTTCFPLFVTGATGDLGPKSGSNLAFNSSTGMLTATGFTGPLTGNAATVTNGVYTTDSGTVSNTMLANSSITVSDGSNTSPVALGGTMTFSGTTNEVTVVESAGTVTIGLPDDVTISGNLTVSGNTTTVNTATLSVEDPLIILASGNSSADAVDIGFYGLYDTSGSLDLYAGLFRDANDSGKFKLFKDLQAAPTTTVNTSGTGYAKATLVADIEGALTGNATTATALATSRTIGMTGDVVWTSASFTGAGNVTGSATIQADAVHYSMLNDDCISGFDEITSGLVAADELLYSDGGTLKRVGTDTLATKLLGLASAGTVAQAADHMVFLDGGATGDVIVESIDHFLTAIAGSGISVSSSQLTASGGGGTPTDITVADESSDTTCFPLFVTAATGDLEPKSGSNLAFNSSSGALTATSFVGDITGDVTGNADTATALATGRTIGMTGDVVWTSASFTGAGNVTGSATIQANSVDGTMIAIGSDAAGDIMYNNGTDYVRLAKGSDDEVLTLASGVPSWATASSGGMSAFILEDDDGTEVSISNAEEVKFIGSGITTNWTDITPGSDGDPFDMTFTVDAAQTGITSILATDVKIGEDDQTKIDFETANEIHFYADNAEQVYLADGVFGPQSDSDVDLGTTGVRWKDAYIDTITVTGTSGGGGAVFEQGISIKNGSASAGFINFYEADGDTSGSVCTFRGKSQMGNCTITLPGSTGTVVLEDNTVTLSNKTLTDPVINVAGTDATGDVYYRNASGIFTRLAVGSDDEVLTLASGLPSWAAITSLLATDIKIGEDDQTKIDFETADEIHFYAANVEQVYVADNIFGPQSDGDVDLGSTGVRWKDAFVDSITVTGEVDGASLDISGNADIDGTLEADAYTVDGVALNEYIADTVGAMVGSNTESGITVAYQDGDNTLDFTVGTLNQDTTGTAAIATTVTITDNENTNEDNAIIFTAGGDVDGGNIGLESDGDLLYNPSTGTVTATIFKGNIDAVDGDFDGTLEADAITVGGTALNTVIAGVTVTNATTAAVATAVTITDNENTNENNAIIFTAGGDLDGGNLGLESDGDLIYNPSTGTVTATIFKGNIDAVDGDFDGTLEADAITLGGTALGSLYSPIAGSSSILTVGTIGTGTWAATDVAVAHGGTGASSAGDARTNLGLGSIATKTYNATMGDNANIPDGAAIKVYGDTNWGGGGDITAVVAGDGLSGGATSGSATVTLDLNELTAAVVADGDFIAIIDTNDGNASRKEAVHDLATLFAGTGLTATNSAIAVDTLNQDTTGTAAIATTVTITDNENTNEDNAIIFTAGGDVDGGNIGLESDGDLIYNPSTGTVTATIFKGNIDAVDGDFDGTLEADAITVGGTALASVIAGTTVSNATTAAVATAVTITDNENTNEDNAIIFTAGGDVDGGNIGLESDGDLHYNPSTGTVTATIFKGNVDAVDGDFDGTLEADAITLGGTALGSLYSPIAGSSSILTVGTIGTGVWQGTAIATTYIADDAITGAKIALFDDSLAATSTHFLIADGTDYSSFALSGGVTCTNAGVVSLAANSVDSDQYVDGSIDAAHLAPDIISGQTEITSADADYLLVWDADDSALKKVDAGEFRGGGGGGTPTAITVADTTDTTAFVALFESATGDLGPKTDAGITYNAGTGTLTATAFAGPLTGNVTGNASGTALTVTQAAQTAITSVGTLAGLTVEKNAGLLASFKRITGDGAAYITIDSSAVNDDEDAQLRLKAGVAGKCRVYFGDTADPDIGQICYEHSDNSLGIKTNNTTAISISSAQVVHFGGAITQAPNTATDGGAVDIDCSTSNYHEILMNADATSIVFTNAIAGQRIVVRFKQHSSHIDLNASEGWNSVTVNGSSGTLHWAGGIEPTLTESNNAIDVYGFLFTSTVTTVHGFIIGQDIKA